MLFKKLSLSHLEEKKWSYFKHGLANVAKGALKLSILPPTSAFQVMVLSLHHHGKLRS